MNEAHPKSLKNTIKKLNQFSLAKRDYMDDLFPISEKLSSRRYNQLQAEQANKEFKLKESDLADFRVPYTIIMDSSEVLRPVRKELRPLIMASKGVPI